MTLRRSLSWSTAMHDLRSARLARPAVRVTATKTLPVLVNADGTFNRAGIMGRAHHLARRHQLSQPGRSWRLLSGEALSLAWFEARTAQRARAVRLAA